VQEYTRGRRAAGAPGAGAVPGALRGDLEGGPGAAPPGGAVERYAAQLAESVDPFAEFRRRLASQKLLQAGIPDRAMHRLGQLIVGSPRVRAAAFAYLAALHAVAVGILLRLTGGVLLHIHSDSGDLHGIHREEIRDGFVDPH